jgi:hypothetical protein
MRPIETSQLPRTYRPTMMPGRPRGHVAFAIIGAAVAFLCWWVFR